MKNYGFVVFSFITLSHCMELAKDEVDKVIEDEITQKLSEDLLQSIERKFQVDLEKSVDSVLQKIKLLLQNGTSQIQDNLIELQRQLETMREHSEKEVESCLMSKEAETAALAEKALHQMVVCGYALIGHDPAKAVKKVTNLKTMIKQGLKPIYGKKAEIYKLLKICGHDHDTLKKVIKCVISKSPIIKSSMMDVTSKLIDGVIHLTKLMAHGAMHEACIIEVIKTIEDEAFVLINHVRACAYGKESIIHAVTDNIKENNATELDVQGLSSKKSDKPKSGNVDDMKDLLRRMLSENDTQNLDKNFKDKLLKLQKDLGPIDTNIISSDIMIKDD